MAAAATPADPALAARQQKSRLAAASCFVIPKMTGAVEKKRDHRALTIDFKGFFAVTLRPFVAAFVAMVKLVG